MGRTHAARDTLKRWLAHPRLPWLLPLAAMFLAAPSLWFGLRVDDYVQRAKLMGTPYARQQFGPPWSMFDFADGDPARLRQQQDIGFIPWWANQNVRLRFLRPVTVFTHWVEYRLWPDGIVRMHVQSLLWYGALVALATVLYRRLLGAGWVAGFAALCYAVDDAHAWPVAWLANRNGLLAAFFGLLALFFHDRWRRDDRAPSALLASACLLLGLLSNEGAIAACAYLFAYALFLDRGHWRGRLFSLAPYALVVVGWRVVYSALGYGAVGSETYIDPLHSPLRFLSAVVVRAPILLLGQWAAPPADPFALLPWPAVTAAWWGVAVAVLLILAALLTPLLRRSSVARFWCVGMLLSLAPICATFPMDRLLLFVGFGAMGLVAQFIEAVPGQRAGKLAGATAWALVIIHAIVAPVMLPIRIQTSAMMLASVGRTCRSTQLSADVADKTVIVASAPNVFYTSYLPILRHLDGLPTPRRMRTFGGTALLPVPIRLHRLDDRTILAQPQGGYRWLLVRDSDHPLPIGTKIELAGMTVEVKTLAKGGWPLEVAYTFDVPLEDPSLQWLKFQDSTYVPYTPPGIGETEILNGPASSEDDTGPMS